MSDFKSMMRNQNKSFDAMKRSFASEQKQDHGDNGYWKLKMDKAKGTASAIIRFLPASHGNELPYITLTKYNFKDPNTNRWYIETSRKTLGPQERDPVFESNGILWNSGNPKDKEIAKGRRQTTKFVSNIQVIKDPQNPENDGKVFKYEYGKKIFDMIKHQMDPQDELGDEEPVYIFSMTDGANFKISATLKDGQWNYDMSKFQKPTPMCDGDEDEMEKIFNQQYDLSKEIKVKSYEDLKKHFDRVTGVTDASGQKVETETDAFDRLAQSVAHKETERKTTTQEPKNAFEEDDDLDDFLKQAGSIFDDN